MSKFVRITALLLIFTMLPIFYGFAEEVSENADYSQAIEKLCALGFAEKDENGLFYPDNEITRAEFTAMAVRVTGYDKMVKGASDISVFEDVRTDMWYTPYITYAAQKGIVAGYGSGTSRFYPDETITLTEAVKILVSAMGFKEYSEQNGGYPSGYTSVASQQGLYSGVPSRESGRLLRGEAARLLTNALDAEVMVNTTELSGSKYTKIKLMEYIGLVSAKAVVTQSGRRALSVVSQFDEDEVTFSDGTVLDRNGINTNELVGYKVEYIYEEATGSDLPKLLYIVKSSQNNEITLAARDITYVSGKTITAEDDNGRKKTYNISSDVQILYNGMAVESFSTEMLKPELGYLRLISNSGSEYNVVFIESYTNVYVSGKDSSKAEIYDRYNVEKRETLSEEDGAAVEITDADGNLKTFEDISVGDVVSVFRSQDGQLIRAVISKNSVTGRVIAIDVEKLVIETLEYEMTPELMKTIEDENSDLPRVNSGSNITAYLDFMGYIAAYSMEVETGRLFAYMKSFSWYDDDTGEGVLLKLFTQNGEHRRIKCAQKLTLDGTSYKKPENIYGALQNLKRYDGLIVYRLNESGEIIYIDTVEKGSKETDQSLIKTHSSFNMVNGAYTGTGFLTYKEKSMSFNMTALMRSTTPIFQVPSTDIDSAPEDYFAVKTVSDYSNDAQVYIDTYKVDTESYYTDAGVVYEKTASSLTINNDSNPAVVKKVYTTIYDDEPVICVEAIVGSQEVKLYPNNADVFKNIPGRSKKDSDEKLYVYKSFKKGDVFRYRTMPNGKVGAVEMLVGTVGERTGDGSTKKEAAYVEESKMFALMRFACRNVYGKADGLIRLTDKNPAEVSKEESYFLETHKAANYTIICVDNENGEVRTGNVNDIKGWKTDGGEFSTVLVQTRYGDARTMIVFDEEIK